MTRKFFLAFLTFARAEECGVHHLREEFLAIGELRAREALA